MSLKRQSLLLFFSKIRQLTRRSLYVLLVLLTYDHEGELEPLLDGLPVDLVGEVGEPHVAVHFPLPSEHLLRVGFLRTGHSLQGLGGHATAGKEFNSILYSILDCFDET